ncbi:isopentenyl phosphate kinase isoform X3 [Nicotiana tomentosiformis]|uniref:isopentenyl phosphate kinase isoform X3 n=1 Tax=Nicotiana tomentosiformis TaxID=4098 RepID=UPI00051C0EAE
MEQNKASAPVPPTKRVRCIVKLGGAAITCKNKLETIDEENLTEVSSQLRQALIPNSDSAKILGMDWSKRPGQSEPPSFVDEFSDQPVADSESFIVVHGAGSFGHFQASKSGVHKGGLSRPLVKAGFVATRISRVFLPSECLHSHVMTEADISMVIKAIDAGFIPVLHGDAVLDTLQECTILSGDVIIRHLAAELKPEFVVFLTDVLGVYDRPPVEPGAVLIREIAVREDGSWSVVKPRLEDTSKPVEFTVAAHDTTGGMVTKITEAAMIAKLGIDVYITKAGTDHSVKALSGILKGSIPDDWLGTAIRYMS